MASATSLSGYVRSITGVTFPVQAPAPSPDHHMSTITQTGSPDHRLPRHQDEAALWRCGRCRIGARRLAPYGHAGKPSRYSG
jgi:hypothetical protein